MNQANTNAIFVTISYSYLSLFFKYHVYDIIKNQLKGLNLWWIVAVSSTSINKITEIWPKLLLKYRYAWTIYLKTIPSENGGIHHRNFDKKSFIFFLTY